MVVDSSEEDSEIKVGDRVRVKASVETPRYNWGSKGVSHDSVGVVTRLDSDGEMRVDFPEHSDWMAFLSEMEKVTDEDGGSSEEEEKGTF